MKNLLNLLLFSFVFTSCITPFKSLKDEFKIYNNPPKYDYVNLLNSFTQNNINYHKNDISYKIFRRTALYQANAVIVSSNNQTNIDSNFVTVKAILADNSGYFPSLYRNQICYLYKFGEFNKPLSEHPNFIFKVNNEYKFEILNNYKVKNINNQTIIDDILEFSPENILYNRSDIRKIRLGNSNFIHSIYLYNGTKIKIKYFNGKITAIKYKKRKLDFYESFKKIRLDYNQKGNIAQKTIIDNTSNTKKMEVFVYDKNQNLLNQCFYKINDFGVKKMTYMIVFEEDKNTISNSQ